MAGDRPRSAEESLSADLIAQRGFSISRRGFDASEVKTFLAQVAAEVRLLRQQQTELRSALATAEDRAAHPRLDEQTLAAAVGEETAAILSAARHAATDIRSRAERAAAELGAESRANADAVTGEAETILARRTEEAEAAAAEIRLEAQSESDLLVQGAQAEAAEIRHRAEQDEQSTVESTMATREKILLDLARRRKVIVTQIEQLRAGRDRLIDTYKVVRETLDQVNEELQTSDAQARAAADLVESHVGGDAAIEDMTGRDMTGRDMTGRGTAIGDLAGGDVAGINSTGEIALLESEPQQLDAVLGLSMSEAGFALDTGPTALEQRDFATAATDGPAVPDEQYGFADPAVNGPLVLDESVAFGDPGALDGLRLVSALEMVTEQIDVIDDGLVIDPPAPAVGAKPLGRLASRESQGDAAENDGPGSIGEGIVATWVVGSSPAVSGSNVTGTSGSKESGAGTNGAGTNGPTGSGSGPLSTLQVAGSGVDVDAGPTQSGPGSAAPTRKRRTRVATAEAPGASSASLVADLIEEPAGARTRTKPAASTAAAPSVSSVDEGVAADAIFARIRADRAKSVVRAREVLGDGLLAPDTALIDRGQDADASRERVAGGGGQFDGEDVVGTGDPVESEQVTDVDESVLQRRDRATESIEGTLARKLKRVLQDEQNDLLDQLRALRTKPDPAKLLPERDSQVQRFMAATSPLLEEAVRAGSEFVVAVLTEADKKDGAAPLIDQPGSLSDVQDLAAGLAEAVVDPMRARLERAFETAAGEDPTVLAEALGAGYREWKTQRIEQTAGDYIAEAFARGAFDATPDGTPLRWLVEDVDGPCPDCDDNALAGGLPKGEEFPTGQQHPPAHPGCRCVLVPG